MRSRVAAAASALIASVSTVNAKPWTGPEPTPAGLKNGRGWSPKPTSHPMAHNLKRSQIAVEELFGLHRRQNLDICGYEDALADDPIYCPLGYRCANDIQNYAAGCCTTTAALSNCYLPTECQPYDPSTSSFTPQFTSDLYTTFCNNFEPFCFVRSYLVSSAKTTYYEVGCTTLSLPDEKVYDTYSGETTTGDSSTPSVVTISVTAPNPNNGGALAGSSSGVPGSGGTSGGGGGGTNIGAIVGGVVGGLGGLALLIGIILFCCMRKRKKERQQKTTTNINNNQHTTGYPTQPQQQNFYPPPGGGISSPPPMSQTSGAPNPYDFNTTNAAYTTAPVGAGYAPYSTSQPQQGFNNDSRGGYDQYQTPATHQHADTLSPFAVSSPGGANQTVATSPNLTTAHPDSAGVSRLGSPATVDSGAHTSLGMGISGSVLGGNHGSSDAQEQHKSLNHESGGGAPTFLNQQSGTNILSNSTPMSSAPSGGVNATTAGAAAETTSSEGNKTLEQNHITAGTVYHELGG